MRYLSPLDPAGGGTWIGVNEYSVSLCLLNRQGKPGAASRGLLIPGLIDAPSARAAAARLRDYNLSRFAPFTLAMLDAAHPTLVAVWDGGRLRVHRRVAPLMPLTSSSWDAAGAGRARRTDLARRLDASGRLDTATLLQFHRSHSAGPGPYSTCMHRADAETVSFSLVSVTSRHVRLLYLPSPPCRRAPALRVQLPRAA